MPTDRHRHIALATERRLPELTADDRILLAELRSRGVRAEAAVWDEAREWGDFDAVVIRSCWDSHLRRDRFVEWTRRVERSGARLWNPAPLVEWNSDKRYLRDLESRGVAIVPTRWVSEGDAAPPLAALLGDAGWEEAVVKPAISAGAYETWRTSAAAARGDEARFAALVRGGAGEVLVQPFVERLLRDGEWSLVFFAGVFSHAVRKRPAPGDFRVQPQFGGLTEATPAPASLVADASRVVEAAARATNLATRDVLYARVDGVEEDGRLVLMELECVEPNLFFEHDTGAAGRMAGVLLGQRTARANGE